MNIAIVGGGIVGLALGYKLSMVKGNKVHIYEKEKEVGYHQSGRNSGVLHCGLSYKPGSLKAKLAVSGIKQMVKYCNDYQINHDVCGKIVIASNENETKLLENTAQRGNLNGLTGLKYLSNRELKDREPFVSSYKTLLVPEEGIVDYEGVMMSMKENIINSDGKVFLDTKIEKVEENKNFIYINNNSSISYNIIIYTTGLQSDINYKKFTNKKLNAKIVPFRGEYYTLEEHAKKLVNHLVYPVGNPKFPFLGVHFTRMINGDREVGPNAVLAFKREGYKNTDISISEMLDYLTYPGFLKFIGKNFLFSLNEFSTSILKSSFLKKAQKLIPDISSSDIKSGPAGVRAQGIDYKGNLMMDFEIKTFKNQIHVINAPSPAATSALSIADYIIENYIN
ncbi:MAG: L-2-hydroxyglutarate oxidase [Flammeovirgaceae bacterium TMED290]|nr:MAG: L-2-hydroxyglutarate oxidase [Flammeovirgaceae bacterium TMED290]|tara:strand:- start:1197 stop:2378 length:1182 start_codon:yes stop_codon:yes gene_type:complete